MARYHTNNKCKTFDGTSAEVENEINKFLNDNGHLGISIEKMTQSQYQYHQCNDARICVTIIYRISGA